jgi:hypothetical protein
LLLRSSKVLYMSWWPWFTMFDPQVFHLFNHETNPCILANVVSPKVGVDNQPPNHTNNDLARFIFLKKVIWDGGSIC